MAIQPMPKDPKTTDPATTSSAPDLLSWVAEPGADPQPGAAAGGDGFKVNDPDDGLVAGGEPIMGKDEFHIMVQAMVQAPNAVLMLKKVEPLKSLELASDGPACRKASDALYDTCMDVPWLRWLLNPDQIWLQRSLPIGVFVFGTFKAVRLEMDERAKKGAPDPAQQKAQSEPSAPPPPADNTPGTDQGVTTLETGPPAQ